MKSVDNLIFSLESKGSSCSFTEGTEGWKNGLNVLECNNSQEFIDKIWNHPRTVEFRENLINSVYNGCRSCPIYDI